MLEKNKQCLLVLHGFYPWDKKIHRFPEVICVDTVSHTNKDNFPLLTISGIDSYGEMLIILRAFYQIKELGFSNVYFQL